jgi:hypothetical protein
MKILFKILKGVLIALLVLVIVVVLGRNFIIPAGAGIGMKAMTGLTLKMDKFYIGIFNTKLDIQGLKIYNPKGYEDPVMLDIPRIYVDYHLRDIIGGNIHLNDLKFFLTELVIVKQADGTSNVDGIMKLASKKSDTPAPVKKPAPAKEKKPVKIQLDLVEIKIGRFVTKSYTAKGTADVKEIKLNIDKRYEKQSVESIAADLSKYAGTVLLQMTMNIGLGDVGSLVTGTIGSVGKLGTDAAKTVTNVGKGAVDVGKGAVDEAANVLKGTADGVKNIIKLPFGSKSE